MVEMRVDFSFNVKCPKCDNYGIKNFWRQPHGQVGARGFEYYRMFCKKCNKTFEMRLYDKQPAFDIGGK